MFKKLLIANRGEIACRIIRTARRLGIPTVAVASEADRESLAARTADEVVIIGPPPAAESYLLVKRIIDAARQAGADAVHPGYGFLSENAGFASAVADAGLTFVGPPAPAIAAMGDKLEAKRLAIKAGVSTVPGHGDAVTEEAEAAAIAAKLGYPVMLKAAAGGGGKGMRVVHDAASLREALRGTRSEARAAFADDRVFLEKFIVEPRHIEIQVLGDTQGTMLHLGERECSIQRRHQKVIEEAPSPALDPETRAAMAAQACALARAVGYHSAGTVEFIVDRDRKFYFLEMNTRLQVEHPVTEFVTGLDLVELMIRIAAGEPLPLSQDDVRADGWSIEARLYAEDPTRGFLPSTGRLTRFQPPPETAGVRVDTGVDEGADVSVFYDPMIAKLVVHGTDRAAATDAMRQALDQFIVRGVAHNGSFLAAVVAHPRFAEGRLSVDFIADEFPDGHLPDQPDETLVDRLAAVAAVIQTIAAHRAWRGPTTEVSRRSWVVLVGRDQRPTHVQVSDGGYTVTVGSNKVTARTDWGPGQDLFRGEFGGADFCVQVTGQAGDYRLIHAGVDIHVRVMAPHVAALAAHMPEKEPPDLSRFLLSPMPGLLVSLSVAAGQQVKTGEPLAVIEAMKMENVLRAERDGVVKHLHAAAGDSLAVDQAILELE